MVSGTGRTKWNGTLLDLNFIKKKRMREDEDNEQDDRQQGKHWLKTRPLHVLHCVGKTISDCGFNSPIRQKEKLFWFTGYLVTGLEIISEDSPDTMTSPIHFSSVTYCFCTFVILFFFHLNRPFFCVALGTLLFIMTMWRCCKSWLNLFTIYIYVFCAGASLKQ